MVAQAASGAASDALAQLDRALASGFDRGDNNGCSDGISYNHFEELSCRGSFEVPPPSTVLGAIGNELATRCRTFKRNSAMSSILNLGRLALTYTTASWSFS